MKARLALLAAAMLFALILGEIYVRFAYTFMPSIRIGDGATRIQDSTLKQVFEADPETVWRFKRNVSFPDEHFAFRGMVSNSQRIRVDHVVPPEKAANEFRILFLGDSVTYGWGVRLEETFAYRSQQALREQFPDIVTTSINAGVPAFSIHQGWRLLVTEGLGYAPDLVVVSFGTNEPLSWGNQGEIVQFQHWKAEYPPDLIAWSAVARLAMIFIGKQPPPLAGGERLPRIQVNEFRDLLGRVRDAARARGAAMAVMVEAHLADVDSTAQSIVLAYQLESAAFGRSLQLGSNPAPALIDSRAVFQALVGEFKPSEIFLDHVHPTALGHAALAEALVTLIAPWVEEQIQFERFKSPDAGV